MKLSVIIPWRDRPELAKALQANAQHLRRNDTQVLIVNGGGSCAELHGILEEHGWPGIGRIDLGAGAPFNKGECLNLGAYHARGKALFLLDADVILSDGLLDQALRAVAGGAVFTSIAAVTESAPERFPDRWDTESAIRENGLKRELTAGNGNTATIEFRMNMKGTRTGPGLMTVQRRHYLAVQGMNSDLRGWGFEDFDLQIRLQLLLGLRRKTFGQAIHLTHARSRQVQTNLDNQETCFANYKKGRFLGTYDADVARHAEAALQFKT